MTDRRTNRQRLIKRHADRYNDRQALRGRQTARKTETETGKEKER